jgi:hypothetical protein
MAKVNLGTAISPKKLNVLAQITAKTVIWASNESMPASRMKGADGPWLSASHPELAWAHPLGRMKDPIERRQTLEAAGAGDLGDRPPWCLAEQLPAQVDALRGHGLGEALACALEQHVHVADRNPKQVGHHRG